MNFEPADLLLFYGRDWISRAIELVTVGPSHIGIICPYQTKRAEAQRRETPAFETAPGASLAPRDVSTYLQRGPNLQESPARARFSVHQAPAVLFESTTLCEEPCLITGQRHSGVQAHAPELRAAKYPGRVARLRLTRGWRLERHEVQRLQNWLLAVANEPYDLRGALLSGTRLFTWSALMPYPDLASLFCSELCAAALMRLHRLPLENPSTFNPASLVRTLRRCGAYGTPVWIKQ